MNQPRSIQIVSAGLLLLAMLPVRAEDDPRLKPLLEKIVSPDPAVRLAARAEAAELGAPAVVPLGQIMGEPPPSVTDQAVRLEAMTTARLALDRLVHHAARAGADREKSAVAVELLKLALTIRPDKVRREAVYWLGLTGGDAEATAMGKLLSHPDRHLREAARLALERIPGAAAVAALTGAAGAADDSFRADLVFSVGKKGDPAAASFLKEISRTQKGKARLAAFEGLARLGSPDAAPLFRSVLAESDLPERAQITNELLRFADEISRERPAEARGIYLEVLRGGPAEHQRERALAQLTRGEPESTLDAVLVGLGDPAPRVNRLALDRLGGLKGVDAFQALKKAYEEARPESRPTLLVALHARDKAQAASLVESALTSTAPDLKVTALDLAGKLENVELEALYRDVAAKGGPTARPAALKGLLLVARKHQASQNPAAALSVYTRALELATADEDRSEALKGVVSVGDPAALGTLSPLLKDPLLGTEAADGIIVFCAKLGSQGKKEQALAQLNPLVTGELPRRVRARAAEEMRKLGKDPQGHLLAAGFIVKWWLVGPMEAQGAQALETKFFPEDVIDLVNEQRIEARKFRWQEYGDLTLDGVIDLVPIFRRSDNRVAYAYTEIESPSARDVTFKIGSDEGVAVWLNGQRVHFNNVQRPLKIDEDSVKARFVAGKNKVLVKISNQGGPWAFSIKVTG